MNKYFIFLILTFIISLYTPVLIAPKLLWKPLLILTLFSGVLSLLTLLLFNQPSQIGGDVFDNLKFAHSRESSKDEDKAYNLIKDNFIFVDNSFAKTLIPYDNGSLDDSSKISITNRVVLAEFLKQLNQQSSLVDLVIYDVSLKDRTTADTLLIKELSKLNNNHQLLLSNNLIDKQSDIVRYSSPTYGDVSEEGTNDVYSTHKIAQNDTTWSMAYMLYARFIGIYKPQIILGKVLKERVGGRMYFGINNFIPRFYASEESKLYGTTLFSNGQSFNTMPVMSLSFLNTNLGKDMLRHELLTRKRQNKKTFIFIGSFQSPIEDLHNTIYGTIHGPTIILNVFYGLLKHEHRVSFGLFFTMTLCYLIIHYLILSMAKALIYKKKSLGLSKIIFKLNKFEENIHQKFLKKRQLSNIKEHPKWKSLYYLLRVAYVCMSFFLIYGPIYICLFFSFLLISNKFNFSLNLSKIFVYFIAFQLIISYFSKPVLNALSNEQP